MIVGKGMFSDKNKKHTPCVSVDCSTEIKRIEYNKLPCLKSLPDLQVIDVIFCCVGYWENWAENSSNINSYKRMHREKLKPCLVLLLQSQLIPFISSIKFCYSLDLKSFVM